MKPVSTDRSLEEQRLVSALEWALGWIEHCREAPLPDLEKADYARWEWAQSLLSNAS